MARALKRKPAARTPGAQAPRRSPKPPLSAAEIQARILYRDGLMLVIDKPAGLPVHGGPGGGANLEQCFDALRFGLSRPPALAHRLDRDTSGCLVLGRHPKALRKLGALFRDGKVEKTYWAVVRGGPAEDRGRIDLALRKLSERTGWRMVVDSQGQAASTIWQVLGRAKGLTWLELRPLTGRTHQIRVHCAALGCPVLGDHTYGGGSGTEPLHLHSRAIALPLSANRPPVQLLAAPPPHMQAALKSCGWQPDPARPGLPDAGK